MIKLTYLVKKNKTIKTVLLKMSSNYVQQINKILNITKNIY